MMIALSSPMVKASTSSPCRVVCQVVAGAVLTRVVVAGAVCERVVATHLAIVIIRGEGEGEGEGESEGGHAPPRHHKGH